MGPKIHPVDEVCIEHQGEGEDELLNALLPKPFLFREEKDAGRDIPEAEFCIGTIGNGQYSLLDQWGCSD